jgi:hypothetical protein
VEALIAKLEHRIGAGATVLFGEDELHVPGRLCGHGGPFRVVCRSFVLPSSIPQRCCACHVFTVPGAGSLGGS